MHPIAIACGNALALKPNERVPSTANLVAEAGLPDGVFNVLHGDRETADALITHSDVAALSFVGSTPVARHVHAAAHASAGSPSAPLPTRWSSGSPLAPAPSWSARAPTPAPRWAR
jgi:acyl-CoA reductase-like NAD-dependent aldehyde dehydrogenase